MSTDKDKDPNKDLDQNARYSEGSASGDQSQTNNEEAWSDMFSDVDASANDSLDDSPEALVQQLEQQLVEIRGRELKAQAELENFRRRTLRDVDQQLKFAAMPLVTDLLEVLDNLNRAVDSAVPGSGTEGLVAGVKLVQQQFVNVLGKHHCKQIPSVGKPFDPNVHQAISQQPSDTHAAGTVMVEHSVGYMLHDRVVRPSMVVVSTGSPQ